MTGKFSWVSHLIRMVGAGRDRVLLCTALKSVGEGEFSVDILTHRVVVMRLERRPIADRDGTNLASEAVKVGAVVSQRDVRRRDGLPMRLPVRRSVGSVGGAIVWRDGRGGGAIVAI